jgi:hypothetical protein
VCFWLVFVTFSGPWQDAGRGRDLQGLVKHVLFSWKSLAWMTATIAGNTLRVQVDPSTTIAQLKDQIAEGFEVAVARQRLFAAERGAHFEFDPDHDRPLSDDELVADHRASTIVLQVVAMPLGPAAVVAEYDAKHAHADDADDAGDGAPPRRRKPGVVAWWNGLSTHW